MTDARMKRALHRPSRAAEGDPVAAATNLFDHKPLRLQPSGNTGNIIWASAEPVRILFRCEPLMKIWRRRVLLFNQQLVQRRLLLGRRFQHERNPAHPEREVYRSGVKLL